MRHVQIVTDRIRISTGSDETPLPAAADRSAPQAVDDDGTVAQGSLKLLLANTRRLAISSEARGCAKGLGTGIG